MILLCIWSTNYSDFIFQNNLPLNPPPKGEMMSASISFYSPLLLAFSPELVYCMANFAVT
jgi:hypothetical protein